jgi:thymidylate synthase ThyX
MITAKIEKDSISPSGVRLTTFVLEYPRFIHSELMTHRAFSRNASSSRAIPLKRQVELLKKNIAFPLKFHKNKPGMQAGEPLEQDAEFRAKFFWEQACNNAIKSAEKINELVPEGVHKQYLNRLLEPFAHISVVVTATDYENFFELRHHKDAQPEIFELARQMKECYTKSQPQRLVEGQWHLPFITEEDGTLETCEQIQKSVACCARVSYKNHDKTDPTIEQNKTLYNRLVNNNPPHLSPTEHQAMSIDDATVRSGNFNGWIQYRQTLRSQS